MVYGLLGSEFEIPSWVDFAVGELEFSLAGLTTYSIGCGLFTGLAGIAYVFERLHELGIVDAAPDQFSSVADFIAANLPPADSRRNVDLISGLSGIGFYFLKRPLTPSRQEALLAIIRRLFEILPEPPTPPPLDSCFGERNGHQDIDIGLAHGLAGPLALLNAAQKHVPFQDKWERKLQHCNAWLSGCLRENGHPVLFPSFVPDRQTGRNAWCYGALGVGFALSNATGENTAFAVSTIAARLDQQALEAWKLDGPGLCHGRAGAILFAQVLRDRTRGGDRPCLAPVDISLVGDCVEPGGLLNGSPGALLAHASLIRPGLRSHWLPLFGAWHGA